MTHGIKLQISVMSSSPPPKPAPAAPKKSARLRLEEAVEHASCCVEEGHSREEALTFLRKVYNRLEAQDKVSKEDQKLLDFIRPVMDMYGNYYLGSEE